MTVSMEHTYRERIEWHPHFNDVVLLASITFPDGRQFRFGKIFEVDECVPGEDLPSPISLKMARAALQMSYQKWVRDAD